MLTLWKSPSMNVCTLTHVCSLFTWFEFPDKNGTLDFAEWLALMQMWSAQGGDWYALLRYALMYVCTRVCTCVKYNVTPHEDLACTGTRLIRSADVYIYIYMCLCVCVCVYKYIFIKRNMQTNSLLFFSSILCMHSIVYMYLCIFIYVHICTYVHICSNTYCTHIHWRKHTYTAYTQNLSKRWDSKGQFQVYGSVPEHNRQGP